MKDPRVTPIPGALSDYVQIWTVYERPTDYPDGFVARLHVVGKVTGPTTLAHFGPTLDSVRTQLPPGLVRIARHGTDDARIVESWI